MESSSIQNRYWNLVCAAVEWQHKSKVVSSAYLEQANILREQIDLLKERQWKT